MFVIYQMRLALILLLKVRIKLMDREQLKTGRQQASSSVGYAKNGRGRVQVWKQAIAVIY